MSKESKFSIGEHAIEKLSMKLQKNLKACGVNVTVLSRFDTGVCVQISQEVWGKLQEEKTQNVLRKKKTYVFFH